MPALRKIVSCWLGIALLCIAEMASARIQILLSHPTSPYRVLAEAVSKRVEGQSVSIIELERDSDVPDAILRAPDVLNIAIGSRAMVFALKEMPSIPLLVTLVPSNAYEDLLKTHGPPSSEGKVSAIFLDQPLKRQIAFVRLLMPEKRRMGVLIGQHSYRYVKLLRRLADDYKLTLRIGDARENRIPDAIKDIISGSDFVLALHDSSLLTPNHAKWLLYMAYQRRIPVIGYSKTYVKAGALAALYSANDQIADQAASLLARSGLGKGSVLLLPSPEYPDDFSIEVNHSVAYSFSIRGIDLDAITEQLHRLPKEKRRL